MRDLFFKIQKSNATVKTLWIISLISIVFISSMHTYNDILITSVHGKMLWDLLFSGKLLDFFQLSNTVSGNIYFPMEQYAAYPFLYYLIFAIIELPIWIIEKIFQVNAYNTTLSYLYSKLVLIIILLYSTVRYGMVLKQLGKNDEEINIFSLIYISSMFVFSTICITSQYDIINAMLFNIGFYYWLKKDTKLFVLVFSLSIGLKYFGIMYFIPLLLIEEKKIWKILYKVVLSLIPTFFFMLLFYGRTFDQTGVSGTNIASSYLSKFILINDLQLGNHPIPSFLLIAIISCLFAYFYEYKNEEEKIQFSIFILLLLLGAFCLIPNIIPYWSVLALPVLNLSIAMSNGNENKTVLLETLFGVSITLYHYFFFNWMFCAKTTSAMGIIPTIFGKWPEPTNNYGVDSILMSLGLGIDQINLIYIFALAAWIVWLYFCFPRKEKTVHPITINNLILRTVLNIGLAYLPLVSAIYIYLTVY